MIRFALVIIILGLVPFAIYWMRTAMSGKAAEGDMPLQSLVLQSLVLIIVSMFVLMIFSHGGSSKEGRYVPPSLQNGEVVPGHFEEAEGDEEGADDTPEEIEAVIP